MVADWRSDLRFFGVALYLLAIFLVGVGIGRLIIYAVENYPAAAEVITKEVIVLPVAPDPLDKGTVPTMWAPKSIGHGCPISPTRALTAKHVAVDNEGENVPLMWADGFGHSGIAVRIGVPTFRDVVVVERAFGHDFSYIFKISSVPAAVGEEVYIAAYDFENNLEQRLHTAKIIRNRGGALIYTPSAGPGSSGSCVLRKDGTVIGINSAEIGTTGLGVSIVGNWGILDREVVE